MRKYNANFIEKVHKASKQDQDWQEKKTELRELEQRRLQWPKHWQMIDELIYYKNVSIFQITKSSKPKSLKDATIHKLLDISDKRKP